MVLGLPSGQHGIRVELGNIIRVLSLQIEPLPPPILDRCMELHVEIGHVFRYLDAEGAGSARNALLFTRDDVLLVQLHLKDALPQGPMLVNAQEAFTEDNEARDVLDCVWRKIMDLNPVHIEKCTEEMMTGERETS